MAAGGSPGLAAAGPGHVLTRDTSRTEGEAPGSLGPPSTERGCLLPLAPRRARGPQQPTRPLEGCDRHADVSTRGTGRAHATGTAHAVRHAAPGSKPNRTMEAEPCSEASLPRHHPPQVVRVNSSPPVWSRTSVRGRSDRKTGARRPESRSAPRRPCLQATDEGGEAAPPPAQAAAWGPRGPRQDPQHPPRARLPVTQPRGHWSLRGRWLHKGGRGLRGPQDPALLRDHDQVGLSAFSFARAQLMGTVNSGQTRQF